MRLEIAVRKMATPTANKRGTVTRDMLLFIKILRFYSASILCLYVSTNFQLSNCLETLQASVVYRHRNCSTRKELSFSFNAF